MSDTLPRAHALNPAALQRFFSQDWHIYPAALDPLLLVLLSCCVRPVAASPVAASASPSAHSADATREEPIARRPSHDAYGDEIPKMEITSSGLAIVPVHGPLLKGATGSDKKYYGVISHEDVADDLNQALAEGATKILLDINSPGGTVAGTPELAALIDEISGAVDLFSFNGQLSASAAEYLSAGAVARFGVSSSINGSIGTILQSVDFSRMLDSLGITVNLFTSGKFKGTGNPYVAMTDEQKDYLKSMVKTLGAEFAQHMTAHRPAMKPDQMQGQVFTGKQALEIGLLDQLVQSRAEAIRLIG
jgi:signal peptide peptidase SppA